MTAKLKGCKKVELKNNGTPNTTLKFNSSDPPVSFLF